MIHLKPFVPKSLYHLLILTLTVGLTMATTQADANPCRQTASSMQKACLLDVQEEQFETFANCANLSSAAARTACRSSTWAERVDAREECIAQAAARRQACSDLQEFRYDLDPLLDPNLDFVDPDEVGTVFAPNPYISVVAGRTMVLRAGEEFEELIVIHVTDEVREIHGVGCRVVADVVLETEEEDGEIEYEPVEVTDDWFAQTSGGDVYYCGESARDFEDEVITSIDGSFEAGKDFAKAGKLMAAYPLPGEHHRTEFALGEAEDLVSYVALSTVPTAEEGGDNPSISCADGGGCLKTFDYDLLDPASTEYKYYLPGVGFILAVSMEDGEFDGEREELVCAGDTLDVLATDACQIDDPEELLDELCELNPEAFCD